jgi:O-antigen ligase
MMYLLALTLLLSPAYAIRLDIFGLPTNFLMLWVFGLWVFFLFYLFFKKQWSNFFTFVKKLDHKILILAGLFLLSGIISLFVQGFDQKKLGQFLVLFLQPISLFFIASFCFKDNPKAKNLLLVTCYLLLALMGAHAIFQYLTLVGLPLIYWGNSEEPKRALGFFSHPNFYALFSTPLLALLVPGVMDRLKNWKLEIGNWKFAAMWILGAVGLFLSMSRAAWLGLAAAVVVYLVIAGDKKIRRAIFAAVIVIIIVIIIVPNFRYRVLLPFYGEKSSVSRLSLWQTGTKGIKESPIFGLGLTGFSRQWSALNTDPNLDTHNFPHNIFLDLWVETGLLGLISLAGLIGLYIYRGLRLAKGRETSTVDQSQTIHLAIALFLITFLIQGQIDNPYFKNDLALVFWLVLSLGF